MKILFFCDEYPPAKTGGIGSATKIVAEELVKRGHEIFVVGNYDYSCNLPYFSIINDVKIFRLKCFSYSKFVPNKLLKYINYLLTRTGIFSYLSELNIKKTEDFILELIKIEKIDLIELVDFTKLIKNLKKVIEFKRFPIPTILRVHGCKSFFEYYQDKIQPITLANDTANFKRADVYLAVSHFISTFIIETLNINKKKVNMIYNPIDSFFLENKSFNKINTQNILFVGKIIETKGAFSLIKAFNIIATIYPDIKLIMIGGGELDKGMSLVNEKYVNRVEFRGYVQREQIRKEIDQCKFAVVPSYFESMGMVAIEIMARGKALIFTNRSAGPEMIKHNFDGLLVDPTNVDDIVDKMKKLLINDQLRISIESNARKKIKNHFSQKMIVDQLETFYKATIHNMNRGIK
ncbi:glycosyltransferase family 4 protein [Maribacter sp. TH_r10]|uniref:glycosyltransferase family 4 protein n=1 Tax=Maribacter sp. TH_r10 TaxID=3082086 RepID=UPI002955A908|nr:glycosyltransferase family 4 protein [Maribacter sp. TH_r10]MDV7140118.1 glycosyltransferase family 4 protein [Maribacter sp. TH_r10]